MFLFLFKKVLADYPNTDFINSFVLGGCHEILSLIKTTFIADRNHNIPTSPDASLLPLLKINPNKHYKMYCLLLQVQTAVHDVEADKLTHVSKPWN